MVEPRRIEGFAHTAVLPEALDERHQLGRPQEIEAAVVVVVGERAERFRPQRHTFVQPVGTIRVKSHWLVDPAHSVYGNLLHQQFLLDEFGGVGCTGGFVRCCWGNCGIGWCWVVDGFHEVSLVPLADAAAMVRQL